MKEILNEIRIGDTSILVKNYHCVDCGDRFVPRYGNEYLMKSRTGLRLYVHVSDQCNGACPFCRRKDEFHADSEVDPAAFESILRQISPFVASVDFTGGEPMCHPELVDELIGIADRVLAPETEIDLVTNGTNLHMLPDMKNTVRLTSVHLSRHAEGDLDNRKLMGFYAPSFDKISNVLRRLDDPGKIVLNCVLHKGGIEAVEDVADYLDFAINLGVRNNSFIGMFRTTAFCIEHYISPWSMPVLSDDGCKRWNESNPDKQFFIWNRHADHDWCRCLTGSYQNSSGRTRFYFRCPGEGKRPTFCRQLLYTAENELVAGYGCESKMLLSI